MSYNDRLEEAAIWAAAQPGDTVPLPREAVVAALWEARGNPGGWPWQLAEWVRDPAHRALHWSQACWNASVPAEEWDDYTRYLDDAPIEQPTHGDAACDNCACPCHEEAGQ